MKVCGSYKGGTAVSDDMKKITLQSPEENAARYPDEDGGEAFKPLTAQEARQWRQKHKPLSLWRALLLQVAVAVTVVLLVFLATGSRGAMWSAAYGGLAVVLPAALFARGMARSLAAGAGGAALAGLFIWEGVKVALTVAMLFAAPRLLGGGLHWMALMAGFVLTLKSYWLALWLQAARGGSGVGPA